MVVDLIVPTPVMWTAGEQPDADMLTKRCSDFVAFLLETPTAQAVQTVSQLIPTSAWTKLTLDSSLKDNDGIVDLANDKLVIQTPGWYEVEAGVGFLGVDTTHDPTGKRIAAVRLNGVTANGGLRSRRDVVPDRTGSRACWTGGAQSALFLNAGDYIELMAYQDSGVSRGTDVQTAAQPSLSVHWVSN